MSLCGYVCLILHSNEKGSDINISEEKRGSLETQSRLLMASAGISYYSGYFYATGYQPVPSLKNNA